MRGCFPSDIIVRQCCELNLGVRNIEAAMSNELEAFTTVSFFVWRFRALSEELIQSLCKSPKFPQGPYLHSSIDQNDFDEFEAFSSWLIVFSNGFERFPVFKRLA